LGQVGAGIGFTPALEVAETGSMKVRKTSHGAGNQRGKGYGGNGFEHARFVGLCRQSCP
jgi:hypothetical protein